MSLSSSSLVPQTYSRPPLTVLLRSYIQGNLSRQEAVSMIPPLLLDVQPHHLVRPLSLTFSLPSSFLPSPTHPPQTLLLRSFLGPRHVCRSRIQNRSTPRSPPRFFLLRYQRRCSHRSRRRQRFRPQTISTPRSPELKVAQCERYRDEFGCFEGKFKRSTPRLAKRNERGRGAGERILTRLSFPFSFSQFPKISLGPEGQEKYGQKSLQFDRILCDVPFVPSLPLSSNLVLDSSQTHLSLPSFVSCSGDGTMRKNAQIWNKWMVGDGNGLHS